MLLNVSDVDLHRRASRATRRRLMQRNRRSLASAAACKLTARYTLRQGAAMRRKSRRTRQRIIDAAYESFWRPGFTRTSVDSIAGARRRHQAHALCAISAARTTCSRRCCSATASWRRQRLRAHRRPPARRPRRHDRFVFRAARAAGPARRRAGRARASRGWWSSSPTCPAIRRAPSRGAPRRRPKPGSPSRLAQARVSQPRERAREIMLLMEGAMALMLIHGDRGYIDAAARAAKRLVRRA